MRKKSNKVPKASLFPLINKEKKSNFLPFLKKPIKNSLFLPKKEKYFLNGV